MKITPSFVNGQVSARNTSQYGVQSKNDAIPTLWATMILSGTAKRVGIKEMNDARVSNKEKKRIYTKDMQVREHAL